MGLNNFRKIVTSSYAVSLKKLMPQPVVRKAHTSPSYLLGPGKHLPCSPVVGSRSREFDKVSYSVMNNPLLKELGKTIYDIKYRLILPNQQRKRKLCSPRNFSWLYK